MIYPTIEDAIGKTPLVALQRMAQADSAARGNVILGKLEGNNPAGSVKDRPALSMIQRAEERGDIRPGDTLIEATSGNTGIALAMICAAHPCQELKHSGAMLARQILSRLHFLQTTLRALEFEVQPALIVQFENRAFR